MVAAALFFSVSAAIIFQFCNKKLLRQELASTVISYMYALCALTTSVTAFFLGQTQINFSVFAIGIVNALAAWAFFRALSQGVSKTILFLPLTRVVALTASAIFLSEWKFFDPRALAGFLTLTGTLATLSAVLFFGKKSFIHNSNISWVKNLIGFVLLSGGIDFLTKYFADTGVPLSQFIFSWYLGALLGSTLPRFLEKNNWPRFRADQFLLYCGLSLGTLGSVSGIYWALQFAPAALVFPIHSFAYATATVLMGLFIFKERNNFGTKEWVGMALGTIGTILIIVGIY